MAQLYKFYWSFTFMFMYSFPLYNSIGVGEIKTIISFDQDTKSNNISQRVLNDVSQKNERERDSCSRKLSKIINHGEHTHEFEKYDILSADDIVRDQYNAMPYPPVTEKELLQDKDHYAENDSIFELSYSSALEALNHYLYQGNTNFTSEFRCLIAGGGTNGGVYFMAEQLRNTNAETVYIDFGKSSIRIAQQKVKHRGNLQIVWVTDWIESIPLLGLGQFDYVSSTGVLHHLKSPQIGLNVINSIQTATGGALLSLYSKYGRTGVYQIQDLLSSILTRSTSLKIELNDARIILSILKENHWFHVIKFADTRTFGDSGIYDLLLHKRDVCYTMFELGDLISDSGYNFVDLSVPDYRLKTSLLFVMKDLEMLKFLRNASIIKQRGIGELIYGRTFLPEFYISKIKHSEASLQDKDNVIYPYGNTKGISHFVTRKNHYKTIRNRNFTFAKLSRTSGKELGSLLWPFSDFNHFILYHLTKLPIHPRSSNELIIDFNKWSKRNISIDIGQQMIDDLFSYIKEAGILFIKNKNIPQFPLTCCFNLYSISKI